MKTTKITKHLKHLILLPVAAFMLLFAQEVMAWGPERPTYTNDTPAPYATFNSITDNVAVGDERDFVRIGEVGSTEPYKNEIEVVPGKEYEVYIYFHNDAGSNTNATGYGIATQTRIASSYPTTITKDSTGTVNGVLTWNYVDLSDQTHDGKIWDEAYLKTSADSVNLKFKTGSAIIHNAGAANGSVLSTNLFTEAGTLIGFNELKGVMPGCAEYSGYITYTLIAENPASELTKQISLDGENWSDTVTANPGDYVTYRVAFKNTGNTTLKNVIFKDTHTEGLSLRTGSTIIYDVNHTDGYAIDDILDLSGYNVGDVAPGALVQIVYQAKIADDLKDCTKLGNVISVAYNGADQKSAKAFVKVNCADSEEPPVPAPCATDPTLPGCSDPVEPETPTELPNTGPVEIIMAVIIVLGIAAGGFHFFRTQRTLSKVQKDVSGKKSTAEKHNTDSEELKTPNNREAENLNQKPVNDNPTKTSSQKS